MKAFAELYLALDATTSTQAKVDALVAYFRQADEADAAWAAYFLSGGKPRQVLPTATLRSLACAEAGIDDWLFEASYQAVGDLAETIALLLPAGGAGDDTPLAVWIEQRLLPLRTASPEDRAAAVLAAWRSLDATGRFLLTKLIGGGFRVGVSKLLVQRALAQVGGLDVKQVAQRMMGYTDAKQAPTAARLRRLLGRGDAAEGDALEEAAQPYPFFLAHALMLPLAELPAALGLTDQWQVEWKYDGIRAQLVRRAGQVWLWSRGEELITDRFPEIAEAARDLPDGTVLDGEVLVWRDGQPAPFQQLQTRIGRKTVSRKLLAEAPAVLLVYDLLQWQGADLRAQPQQTRRALLEAAVGDAALGNAESAGVIRRAPVLSLPDWPAFAALRTESRARGVEGFMLKHREAAYGSGRTKADGVWWKWKVEPLTADGVLIYAQAGHGRRASVYTDYTFAVWNRSPKDATEAAGVIEAIARREPAQPGALQLVPFAKAYSGLSDGEFARVDREIRAHTLEKFGPVRSVRPTMVFELAFEGIQRSPRHKSGIAVRFPRMLRLREDKPLHEADTLQTLGLLMGADGR